LTTAIAVQLGVANPEDVLKLLEAVSKIPLEVDESTLSNVLAIVEALTNRIVML